MDKIAIRELLAAGVARAESYWSDQYAQTSPDLASESVLDRITQVGQLALAHEEAWLWSEVIDSLLTIYKLGLPTNHDAWHPAEHEARWLFTVGARVWILGAEAVRRGRFEGLRELVVQPPVERYEGTFWLRYTVTMAARGEIDVFRGKSLIGPISTMIGEKPQFFATYRQNLDEAVNSLCQFDFLACVITTLESKSTGSVYTNFAGYYSERTLPIVEQLVTRGPARTAIPDATDEMLAEVLQALDKVANEHFFGISGWHGYSSPVAEFIRQHAAT